MHAQGQYLRRVFHHCRKKRLEICYVTNPFLNIRPAFTFVNLPIRGKMKGLSRRTEACYYRTFGHCSKQAIQQPCAARRRNKSDKNYTMTVGIITCMTCMFAVALTMGGPIRRHASQSENTVPIGGNVTLTCPLPPDDTWIWVYWKKNGLTIYSLEVQSNTPRTNDTRYEGSNHATRLTIKNLEKTDSGIYHCQVATLVFIKERGHVLLFVTDQEVGLSTASPGVPFRASTMIPPQPSGYNTIFLKSIFIISIIVSIVISVVTLYLVYFNRERERNLPAGCVSAFRRLAHKSSSTSLGPDSSHHEIGDEAPRSSSTPLGPDSSHHDIRDEEGTCTYLLSSDTHGRDDVDVDDRLEESYC